MALEAGHRRSGGNVFDADGRRVLKTVAGGAPLQAGEVKSGGRIFDADGREVVALSQGSSIPDGSVTDAKVAAGAAIAESKLALASDAAAATPSRRTLGTGATQAAAGNDSRFFAPGALTSRARALGTNYLPNAARATLVLATFEIDCDKNELGNVDVKCDTNATPTTVVGSVRLDYANADGINASRVLQRHTVTFVVPAGSSYRFDTFVTGAPVITIVTAFEQTL